MREVERGACEGGGEGRVVKILLIESLVMLYISHQILC